MDNVAHVERVVLLIHGIRTQADWQPMLVKTLEEQGKIKVIPIKYGYFDVFRFLLPFTRQSPVKRVETLLRATRRKYPHARISVIAHSYGSYIIGRLLKEQVDLELDRLILCGSVLPASYPWEEVVHKFIDGSNENILNVINEYGEKDACPVLAKVTSWGYGDSGTHGFGHVFVQDRCHNKKHGEYFNRDFAITYWEPFIKNGEYQPTEFEVNMPTTPWILSILGLFPFKTTVFAGLLFLGWTISSTSPLDPPPTIGKSPDPPSSALFPDKFYVHFKQNGGLENLRDELMRYFENKGGIRVKAPEIIKSDFPKTNSVRFFHDDDRKSAEEIRQQTVDFFRKKNCPIAIGGVTQLNMAAAIGTVELWIDHNCNQGQAK